ncbi:MAG: DUF3095 domain-containing protein [Coleofasciculaceae cyanobacterium SM2_1_6]|nr:DUF3095 domain-containing protein [Coleofasciculaceae cyanobacterium SM2_1_6]
MANDVFYAELPDLEQFMDVTISENFVPVPDDWYVIITDIVGSTQAIKQGRYKEVNFLGACAIISLLNIAKRLDIPFVFGGDGASILIPEALLPAARQALLANQIMAREDFNLELRAGIVPVAIVKVDYRLQIAKLKISDNYSQAVFRGGGLTYATRLVKEAATAKMYQLEVENLPAQADLSGLECRWQDIPSPQGEILSLLVLATAPSESQIDRIYREVIEQINSIYGHSDRQNPISDKNLRLSFSQKNLMLETKARAESRSWWSRLLYLWKIRVENFLGVVLMNLGINLGGVDWREYKTGVTETTDYRKFDDILRMVIAGNPQQSKKLEKFLEKKYQDGRLVYGLHRTDRALMTCLVFERAGRQVHFIDGADGGYSIAAEAMKNRMRS